MYVIANVSPLFKKPLVETKTVKKGECSCVCMYITYIYIQYTDRRRACVYIYYQTRVHCVYILIHKVKV